jgi:hypothetical protein
MAFSGVLTKMKKTSKSKKTESIETESKKRTG